MTSTTDASDGSARAPDHSSRAPDVASRTSDGFRRACLVAAVVVGCAYSAFQILHDVRVPVQLLPGVAARVNGHQIDADSVNRTVAGMDARVRRSEVDARHDVLTRMIDEELLVQHALDSGAAETNPEVRAALVRSAITRVNSEVEAAPLSEQELATYFEAHKEAYAKTASFDVTPVYFAALDADRGNNAGTPSVSAATSAHDKLAVGGTGALADADAGTASVSTATSAHGKLAVDAPGIADARSRASAARNAIEGGTAIEAMSPEHSNGKPAAGLEAAWSRAVAARKVIEGGTAIEAVNTTADALPFAPPGEHTSLRTLANYFGPAIADAVDHLTVGHTTAITQFGNGVLFIYLNNKTPGDIPTLASIRDLVAADALRDRQEHALESLLASLRQSAHIEFAASPNPVPPVAASR